MVVTSRQPLVFEFLNQIIEGDELEIECPPNDVRISLRKIPWPSKLDAAHGEYDSFAIEGKFTEADGTITVFAAKEIDTIASFRARGDFTSPNDFSCRLDTDARSFQIHRKGNLHLEISA